MKKILNWFNCHVIGSHQWTCKAQQNIKPTKEELTSFKGFKLYAKMFCSHCGKDSKLS